MGGCLAWQSNEGNVWSGLMVYAEGEKFAAAEQEGFFVALRLTLRVKPSRSKLLILPRGEYGKGYFA